MQTFIRALLTVGLGLTLAYFPRRARAHANPCRTYLTSLRAFTRARSREPASTWRVAQDAGAIDGEHRGDRNQGVRYNAYFGPVIGGRQLEHLANDRRASGRTAHALDLFGSALFSSEPTAFTSLTGVRREKYQSIRLSPVYLNYVHRTEVVGDLTQPLTWARLDRSARARGIPAFDFVFVRPIGPSFRLTSKMLREGGSPVRRRQFFTFAHALVNRAWRRLGHDRGRLFLEVSPYVGNSPEFRRWLGQLDRAGVEYAFGRPGGDFADLHHALVLTRTPGSPRRLP